MSSAHEEIVTDDKKRRELFPDKDMRDLGVYSASGMQVTVTRKVWPGRSIAYEVRKDPGKGVVHKVITYKPMANQAAAMQSRRATPNDSTTAAYSDKTNWDYAQGCGDCAGTCACRAGPWDEQPGTTQRAPPAPAASTTMYKSYADSQYGTWGYLADQGAR